MKVKYETIEKIGQIGIPLLILHGTKDDKIPLSQSRQLFDTAVSLAAANAPSGKEEKNPVIRMTEIPGGNHINNFKHPTWIRDILDFTDRPTNRQ